MTIQSDGAVFAAKVSARIREFRAERGISAEALTQAANLSAAELHLLETESEDMTRDMVECIAAVFEVHPAVLCMSPNEDAVANFLEHYRDISKDEFQQLAGELISKGHYRSKISV